MKIIMLEAGTPPAGLAKTFGTYGQMFTRMLAPFMPDLRTQSVQVYAGAQLPEAGAADGFIISGSPAGVYEAHDWIAPLEALVREAAGQGTPMVGICFGHQLMAQAFGGRVEKSAKGWGVGVHEYALAADAPVSAENVSCVVSHQDQVMQLPQGAQVLGGSDFCPHGIIAYRQGPALSFQMHPEFGHDFASALLAARADAIAPDLARPAQTSLTGPSSREILARWIADHIADKVVG